MDKILTYHDIINAVQYDFDTLDSVEAIVAYLKLKFFVVKAFMYQDCKLIEQDIDQHKLFLTLNNSLSMLHHKIAQLYNVAYESIDFLHDVIDTTKNGLLKVNGKIYNTYSVKINYDELVDICIQKIRDIK